MKGRFTRVPIRNLKYHSIRQDSGSKEDLKALAKSWLHRPIHPIVVRTDFTLVDGHRRIEGLLLLGETEVDVFVTDEKLDDTQLTLAGLSTANLRAALSQPEQFLAVERILAADPAMPQKTLAVEGGIQEATLSRLLAVGRHPLLRQPFLDGKITLGLAAQIATADPAAQAGMLNLALAGELTREQAMARKRKPAAEFAVKLSRVNQPLSTGVKVSVCGPEMTLSGYCDALAAALDAAKKSLKESLDIKTAAKVWADRAKVRGQ